ncbi:hypothetical protein VCRA2123O444_40073 [Vibrio crassostreae]|nr:hypothetical protein VCRA2113O412_50152 [Vibrio crassostreae]CAK2134731.1 hypothetical protein VCRA2113O414_50152 [Vibrio crassostreae]CAK2142754.1 hypothetical protein VCRA2114O423_60084 [Vibrio crassostreae]CAK2145073.1 hypothetical protein VCRA2118O429_60152 [Vibrio crassostreae]CAK2147704.1 hypothetical protein VCRA2113O413_60151 [Vibrio crassostreae]
MRQSKLIVIIKINRKRVLPIGQILIIKCRGYFWPRHCMKNIINCIALILISISSSFASDELVTQEQLQYLQTKKTIVIAKPTSINECGKISP